MKRMFGFIGALALLVGLFGIVHSANTCTPTDIQCYVSGPSQNTTTNFRVDASGNITAGTLTTTGVTNSGNETITGNETTTGKTIYPPTSQVTVSTSVPIGITATFMMVESTGNMVPLSASVAITTATATSGQFLLVHSTTSVSTIQITTGAATAVIGDDAVIVISSTKSAVGFIYNSTLSQWIEVGRQ